MDKAKLKEELKGIVQESVKEAFDNFISEACSGKKKMKEQEEEDEGETVEEEESKDDDDDEEESSDEEDDTGSEDITESLTVVASDGKKTTNLKVANMKELTRIAKAGQYDHFVVKSNTGEEEYMVDKGRLILL